VLDVGHAQAIVRAVFDGVLGAAVGHRALQRDDAVADVDRHVADVQAAVAEPLAQVFAHALVAAHVAFGGDALRFAARLALPAIGVAAALAIVPVVGLALELAIGRLIAVVELLALPARVLVAKAAIAALSGVGAAAAQDRKSTRLNSSHVKISYAV